MIDYDTFSFPYHVRIALEYAFMCNDCYFILFVVFCVSVKRCRCISHVCGCVSVLARAPKGIEVFWKDCCESDSPFCCSTDGFLRTLRKHYIHKVKAKQPGQTDAGADVLF